jgi:hypothetical protein
LLGYSGQKANFPVAKFGHISLITDEAWYFNPESKLLEQGYVLDLSNAPGLSGAPVFAHGMEFEASPFRFRELPPYVVDQKESVHSERVPSRHLGEIRKMPV